jgi:hypothetical protein
MIDFLLKLCGRKKAPPPPPAHSFDFEKDMKYLFSLIATLMENERFKMDLHKKRLLTDDDILTISRNITTDVMEMISPQYMSLLNRYIAGDDKVVEFVSLVVVKNTVQLGLSINRNVV